MAEITLTLDGAGRIIGVEIPEGTTLVVDKEVDQNNDGDKFETTVYEGPQENWYERHLGY